MFMLRFDMRAPEFGAPIGELYETAIEMAVWAERTGCVGITLSEHHCSADGYLPSPMVLASAVASRTSTVSINIAALLLNFYDPVKVAEDMAVLDAISGGRVSYVIGLGYRREEYEQFGVDFDRRGAVMDEKVDVLLRALRGEQFEYQGRKVRCSPCPPPGRPFIAYGGQSVAAARRAGRYGLSFLGEAPNDALEQAYLDACAEHGHEPGMFFTPKAGQVASAFVAEDPDDAWERWGKYLLHDAMTYASWLSPEHRPISRSDSLTVEDLKAEKGNYRILTPDEAVEYIRTHGALAMQPLCGGLPPDLAWESLHALEKHVLPRLAA